MRKVAITLLSLVLVASMASVSFAAAPKITPSSPSGPVNAQPAAPAPADVLWDQPVDTNLYSATVDQEFPDFQTFSSFLSDDFVNAETWNISTIYVPGDMWNGATSLLNASMLHWAIYADNGGVPAGWPGGGQAPVWSLDLVPTDPQVTLATGFFGFLSNTTLNLATPVSLPAGHWWLLYYPTMLFSPNGQFGLTPATTANNNIAQFINPGNGFGFGTSWQTWAVVNPNGQHDIAFRLEGTPGPVNIPAHLNRTKINWMAAARPGFFKVVFAARVWDNENLPAVGTTVFGTWTYPDGSTHDKTYVTDAMGRAKFPVKEQLTGNYTFCVTDISGGGYMYDPGANTAPDCLTATVVP